MPLRTCRVCRAKKPKSELTRWTVSGSELLPDLKQTSPGRGFYTCSDKCAQILPKVIKKRKS